MNKEQRNQEKAQAREKADQQSVVMKFKDNKFYNDQEKPLYEAGKEYRIQGADMIQRWLKRGGEIVGGELEMPDQTADPSHLVPHPLSSGVDSVAPHEETSEDVQEDEDLGEDEETPEGHEKKPKVKTKSHAKHSTHKKSR